MGRVFISLGMGKVNGDDYRQAAVGAGRDNGDL